MLVTRRKKRRARERGEKPKKPTVDALESMRTLRAVKRAMARLAENENSNDEKLFTKATFIIHTFPDRELIKCKHHADWRQCRGNVEQGRCRQCRVFTPGVLNYSFQILIHDKDDSNHPLYVNISDRGGTSGGLVA